MKNTPKRKHLNRVKRLRDGKGFVQSYEGKNIVKGYAKWYGVDKLCAINELRVLGVNISMEYEETIRNLRKPKMSNKINKTPEVEGDAKYFVAGETSNGVPFGIIYDDKIEYLDEQVFLKEKGDESEI